MREVIINGVRVEVVGELSPEQEKNADAFLSNLKQLLDSTEDQNEVKEDASFAGDIAGFTLRITRY